MSATLKMEDLKILVREAGWPGYWGKADTLGEALKNANNPKYYEVFIVTDTTQVNSVDGGLSCNAAYPPRLIHSVLPKQKKTRAK